MDTRLKSPAIFAQQLSNHIMCHKMNRKNPIKTLPKLRLNSADITTPAENRFAARTSSLVGNSNLLRLSWIVSFAEAADSVERLSPVKFERLIHKIETFAKMAGSTSYKPGERIDIAETLRLAMMVRDGLRAYANGSSWDLPHLDFDGLGLSLMLKSNRSPWVGPWRTLFMIATADLLRAEGSRLRLCPSRPGFWPCSRIFVRRKSGLYCSKECSQYERTRRSRKHTKKSSDKRHQAYVRSKQKETGNVEIKVERRPRREPPPRTPGMVVLAPMPQDPNVKEGKNFLSIFVDHRGTKSVNPFPQKRGKRIGRTMPTIAADPVIAVQIADGEVYCLTKHQTRTLVMNANGWCSQPVLEQCLKSGFLIELKKGETDSEDV